MQGMDKGRWQTVHGTFQAEKLLSVHNSSLHDEVSGH